VAEALVEAGVLDVTAKSFPAGLSAVAGVAGEVAAVAAASACCLSAGEVSGEVVSAVADGGVDGVGENARQSDAAAMSTTTAVTARILGIDATRR
jgi:spore maturation protein SpmB